MKVNLNVSGFETEATFPDADVKRIHQPLIENLLASIMRSRNA